MGWKERGSERETDGGKQRERRRERHWQRKAGRQRQGQTGTETHRDTERGMTHAEVREGGERREERFRMQTDW